MEKNNLKLSASTLAAFMCLIVCLLQFSGMVKADGGNKPANLNLGLNLAGNTAIAVDIMNFTDLPLNIVSSTTDQSDAPVLAQPGELTIKSRGGVFYGSVIAFANERSSDWELRLEPPSGIGMHMHIFFKPVMKIFKTESTVDWGKLADEVIWAVRNHTVDPDPKKILDMAMKDYEHWKKFNPMNTTVTKMPGGVKFAVEIDEGEDDSVYNYSDHMVTYVHDRTYRYALEMTAMRGNGQTAPRLRVTLWKVEDYIAMRKAQEDKTKTPDGAAEIKALEKLLASNANSTGGGR